MDTQDNKYHWQPQPQRMDNNSALGLEANVGASVVRWDDTPPETIALNPNSVAKLPQKKSRSSLEPLAPPLCAPIFSLPEEVLVMIFETLLGGDYERHAYRRTTLALVSRQWFQIVYNTPSLWTSVSFAWSPQHISLVLEKSKQTDLKVGLGSHSGISDGSFKEVCRHIHRWRTVELELPTSLPRRLKCLERPADRVQEVSIWACGQQHVFVDLFSGTAPRLTHVTLSGVGVAWESEMFSGLLHLKLDNLSTQSPEFDEVITILGASPNLLVLNLRKLSIIPSPNAAGPRIQLPRLHEIVMEAINPAAMGQLLDQIEAPHCQKFSISCVLPEDQYPYLSFLQTSLPLIAETETGTETEIETVLDVYNDSIAYQVFAGLSDVTIEIKTPSPHQVISLIASFLPPHYLALPTEVYIGSRGSPRRFHDIINAADALNVTSMSFDPSESTDRRDDGMNTFLYRLSTSMEGGRWLLQEMRTLKVYITKTSPGNLRRMMEARNAEGGSPITELEVQGALKEHDADRLAIERLIGARNVHWEVYDEADARTSSDSDGDDYGDSDEDDDWFGLV